MGSSHFCSRLPESIRFGSNKIASTSFLGHVCSTANVVCFRASDVRSARGDSVSAACDDNVSPATVHSSASDDDDHTTANSHTEIDFGAIDGCVSTSYSLPANGSTSDSIRVRHTSVRTLYGCVPTTPGAVCNAVHAEYRWSCAKQRHICLDRGREFCKRHSKFDLNRGSEYHRRRSKFGC